MARMLDKEHPGNNEPVSNLPVYFISNEQPGIMKQFCDEQRVPYS